MTNAHSHREIATWRSLARIAALAMALVAPVAWAQTNTVPPPPKPTAPPPPQQRSILIVHPTPAERARQLAGQEHLRSVIRSNAVQERIRRQSAATARKPSLANPQLQQQLRQADRAQQRHAAQRRDDLLKRYRRAALPPASTSTVPPPRPAPASSG